MKRKNIIVSLLPILLIPLFLFAVDFYRRNLSFIAVICPFRFFLGIYCLGCGGTHSIYAIASGHFLQALKYNPLVFTVFVLAVLYWLENILAVFGKRVKIFPVNRKFYLTVSGILIVFFILRIFLPILAPL